MNPLVLTCLLCFVVCAAVSAEGSEVTYSTELSGVTGGPSSGEGLQSSLSDDDEVEEHEDVSAGANQNHVFHMNNDERRKRKGKGKKRNRQQVKSTTSMNPEYSFYTSGYESPFSTTLDPCTSSHLGYCIHGYCKYMEGLPEPVCICMKGYDGERCGIQTLLTGRNRNDDDESSSNTELVQTVLVVIAVVLSVISCAAIILMTCAHYRSHKNFLASYLGTATEQEKLQKPSGDAMV
ncbi:amphiregulin [Sphaeramia orbicularis]|uniref:EGF-like domain-containing protein n=1 Tax=Sphaeramia orbicularis TaxID=375764 RepID=A0A672YGV2_9TELE|nr:amphiregulin [Sphaeramia orbicularis]